MFEGIIITVIFSTILISSIGTALIGRKIKTMIIKLEPK